MATLAMALSYGSLKGEARSFEADDAEELETRGAQLGSTLESFAERLERSEEGSVLRY